jgi:hypothetical protein
MTTNQEKTQELLAQLERLNVGELSASTLGHANYAWLNETKAATPYSTPDAASQMYAVLRKRQTVGETTQERIGPFLEMLASEEDPIATIQEWSLRNGHEPQAPGLGGGTVERRTEVERAELNQEVDDELVKLLAPIQERYDAAKREVDRLGTELAKARAEANRLLAILKAAGIVERMTYLKKESAPKPRKQKHGTHVSDETALKILEGIRGFVASNPPALEDVPGSFTRPAIEKGLGLHHSQLGAAVEKLREQGYIRAAGLTTKSGQKTSVFAVVA